MSAAPRLDGVEPERLAMIARALQIPPATWLAALAAFRARLAPAPRGESASGEIERCLAAFAAAYRERSPHAAPPPQAGAPRACPACGQAAVRAFLSRRSPSAPELIYGRCDRCGHGALLDDSSEGASPVRYAARSYFQIRDAQGAGYDRYDDEAAYRERKGSALVERMQRARTRPFATLLEIGSGYGFTRAAAERAGVRTAGVDVSPHAAAESARRYGLATFPGTLAEALASTSSVVPRAGFDAVLYQFVLEHVVDPIGELRLAREAAAPDALLALLVPSVEAAELVAFGASYRSLRADHLHLFSRASLATVLERAGFVLDAVESHCNMHLLRDLLSTRALAHLYASGRGPDLLVLARRRP